MFGIDSVQGSAATMNKTAKFFALSLCLAAVSACGGVTEPSDLDTVKALTPTSNMPTGTARYLGQVTSTTSWDPYVPNSGGLVTDEVVVYSADLALNANFTANTVSATLTNEEVTGTHTYTPVGGSATQRTSNYTFNGVTTGSGTIAGNVFGATVGGNYTAVGTDFDGSAINTTGNATVNIGGYFVGTNADGIYGTLSGSGVNGVGYTYVDELWGVKQ